MEGSKPTKRTITVDVLIRGYVGSGKTSFCKAFVSGDIDGTLYPNLPLNQATITQLELASKRKKQNQQQVLISPNCALTSSPFVKYCKTIELENILPYASSEAKQLLSTEPTGTVVCINVLDTSGFDYGVQCLPVSMLRKLNAILLLVPMDSSDMIMGSSLDWCRKAFDVLNHNLQEDMKSKVVQLIGTKCDLAYFNSDFISFAKQTLQNNVTIQAELSSTASSVHGVYCYTKEDLFTGSLKDLMYHYWSRSPAHAGSTFTSDSAVLIETIGNSAHQSSVSTMSSIPVVLDSDDVINVDYKFPVCSAWQKTNVDGILYKTAAKVISNSIFAQSVMYRQQQQQQPITKPDTIASVTNLDKETPVIRITTQQRQRKTILSENTNLKSNYDHNDDCC